MAISNHVGNLFVGLFFFTVAMFFLLLGLWVVWEVGAFFLKMVGSMAA